MNRWEFLKGTVLAGLSAVIFGVGVAEGQGLTISEGLYNGFLRDVTEESMAELVWLEQCGEVGQWKTVMPVSEWVPLQDVVQAIKVLRAVADKVGAVFEITVSSSVGMKVVAFSKQHRESFNEGTFGERALNAVKWAMEG